MTAEALAATDLAGRLGFVAGMLNRRLRPGPEGLTHVGLSALASIERAGAVRPGDLARTERIAAPAMTRVVADLEGRGLVVRAPDPADGRSQLLSLADEGRAALERARLNRAAGVSALLADLDAADLAAVERAVAALERALLA